MRKTFSLLGIAAIIAVGLAPIHTQSAKAQTAPITVPCSTTAPASPMPGHYTGAWQSEGSYDFNVFNRDVHLQVTINGTIDATITPDGHLAGTVQGTVDAPVTHEGQRDVSSGTGTISGQLQGVFSPSGSLVVLSQPVIDMHWGTFVGGGYTVERFITMPDYQFPVTAFGCIDASGTISEDGFPVQNLVDDLNGVTEQVPGIGTASGSWQLTSDASATYNQLSQQVDSALSAATSLLNDPSTVITPGLITQQIVQPIQQLEATIQQNPAVARCLLERIGTWEATALPALLNRASAMPVTDAPSFRQAADILRAAEALNLDCAIPTDSTTSTLSSEGHALLDSAVSSRDWPAVMLLWRELVLLDGPGGQSIEQQHLITDLHALVSSTTGSQALDLARVAYAAGDDTDASALVSQPAAARVERLSVRARLNDRPNMMVSTKAKTRTKKHKRHQTKRKSHHAASPKPTPKPRPTATSRPTATPTATPQPKTLPELLATGITQITATAGSSTTPGVSWQPMSGASSYLVTAVSSSDRALLFTWSGTATSVTYGDTTSPGTADTANDGWPNPNANGGSLSWRLIALDAQGHVIGAAFLATIE